jgi:hypothetical protein
MRELRISLTIADGWASFSLKIDSITLISVAVVSKPQNATLAAKVRIAAHCYEYAPQL